ncbi:hypothetical protein GGS26DRAFT_550381 [Hypomontagnella submonticulosa]|nr:hypothetical protein GGS26DRAFT_550381 [Hypomontagnella submonticulosa]
MPQKDSKLAERYFEAHKGIVTQHLGQYLRGFDDAGFFISEGDKQPYLVIIMGEYYPYTETPADQTKVSDEVKNAMGRSPLVPEYPEHHLDDLYEFVVVKKSIVAPWNDIKILWPDSIVAPDGVY